MNHVTEAALTHPEINAAHLDQARRDAWSEVGILMECLDHLPSDHSEHITIARDINHIINLPGME